MNKKTVEDLRIKEDDNPLGKYRDRHPSYGMVSIGNISCGGKGVALFGSGISHNHFIMLEINHAERVRDEYTDHYFSRNKIAEIYLSAAQFAGLITKTNTSGVPCTIHYTEANGMVEDVPRHNVKRELQEDLKRKYSELAKRVSALTDQVKESLDGNVKKADKENILNAVHQIHSDISSNMAFLQTCQMEKLEEIGSQIVAEAEASINSLITSTGIETLKSLKTNSLKQIENS